MAKDTGRNAAIGLAKEATRGTAESSADVWVPRLSMTIDDKTESINDESALGILEDAPNADNVKTWGEAEIEGNVRDRSLGHFLLALFGSVSTSDDDPVASAYTHTFSVQQAAQHQSYTLFLKDHVQSYKYALGCMTSFSLSAELGQYLKFTSGWMTKQGATMSAPSPSYLSENLFLPKNITVQYASTLAGLSSPTEVKVKSFSINADKAVEEDMSLGDSTPQDYLTKMFSFEGEMELLFDAETFKTQQLANTKIALRLEVENDTDDLGSGNYPRLRFDFAKVHISDFSRNYGNGDLISASVSFKGLYSTSDSKMVEAELINAQASY